MTEMQKKIVQEIQRELQERMTDRAFLKKIQWSKKNVLQALKGDTWTQQLRETAEGNDVSCSALLGCCQETMDALTDSTPEKGWLPYIYAMLRKGLFADSVVMEESQQKDRAARFYLEALRYLLDVNRTMRGYDPTRDFDFASGEETEGAAAGEEFGRFCEYFQKEYIYELMVIGHEIMPFDTLGHIAGVHHVAMHTARQMKVAGVPVDLALVSGAAAGHDMGKYGCRQREEKRIPYLHYYYTDLWFKERHMPVIGHIAANHSTWDLELENLSVESLLLIYADFRVKNAGYVNGKEQIVCYTLADSFQVILNKLDNVDQAKEERYRHVYAKLADFERYMISLGVDTTLNRQQFVPKEKKDAALLDMEETVEELKYMAISHNIFLMNRIGGEASFGAILEAARSEKDWKNIRAYIGILDEYSTYMSQKQKWMSLEFLYELLSHREGDIRRQAAGLLGTIIVNYDEEYRKELPEGIQKETEGPDGFQLWCQYLGMILEPDHKVTDQHRSWIGYALKITVKSVLSNCKESEKRKYLEPLLAYYQDWDRDDLTAFILLHVTLLLPLALLKEQEISQLVDFARYLSQRDSLEIRVGILRLLEYLSHNTSLEQSWIKFTETFLQSICPEDAVSLRHLAGRVKDNWKLDTELQYDGDAFAKDTEVVSDVFLENLKAATPWIVKVVNIDLLLERVHGDINTSVLHVATHLSNLLKVSERITVRHRVGKTLLEIAPLMSYDQRNEVAIELVKGLEIGEYQFSKYIPEYLGAFVLYLHPKELDELIKTIGELLISTNQRVVCVALDTVGIMLEQFGLYPERFSEDKAVVKNRAKQLLGMLLNGLANYRQSINQEALLVMGRRLFASESLSLDEKKTAFRFLHKKLVTMVRDEEMSELGFYNSAATLNHIYRFISDYLFYYNRFEMREPKRVAFFPGTYDPFSLSHKEIAKTIRDMGFLVYLALDEFSWSKKTQPRMIRRQIMAMSIADEQHIYLFPDHIPVNISNPSDLRRLKGLFPGKEVYMVAGSDVVEKASAYRKEVEPDSIQTFSHILFRRASLMDSGTGEYAMDMGSKVLGDLIELSLPVHLEDISSTRIRENVDLNRDISNLIAPLAQNFIYENNLYLREPQYKRLLQKKSVHIEVADKLTPELERELMQLAELTGRQEYLARCVKRRAVRYLLIRGSQLDNGIIGAATFRHVGTKELYSTFKSTEVANYIREHTSGKIVHISGVFEGSYRASDYGKRFHQLLLSEVVAYCLAKDYTYGVYCEEGIHNHQWIQALERQGFCEMPFTTEQGAPVYTVDMKYPVVLMQNLDTVIKEPLNHNPKVEEVMERTHQNLQTAMTRLYPGNLVLSVDAGIIHHKMIDLITNANKVPEGSVPPGTLGKSMCVPFGKILRGVVVPNTVTKALHTEKTFEPAIRGFRITEYPNYSPLENQIRTIKSFNRPVILVDELLHKGYRIKELDPIFKQEKVEIDRIVVGILSGRGKDLMDIQKRKVESVYFLPSMRSWFVESSIYPFIGGDTVAREEKMPANLLNSINFILPYVAPRFLAGVPQQQIYELSMTCLENARELLLVLEEEYQNLFGRNLTLNRLSEVIKSPSCPDKGGCLSYDYHLLPSVYVENDVEKLMRLKDLL